MTASSFPSEYLSYYVNHVSILGLERSLVASDVKFHEFFALKYFVK